MIIFNNNLKALLIILLYKMYQDIRISDEISSEIKIHLKELNTGKTIPLKVKEVPPSEDDEALKELIGQNLGIPEDHITL